MLSASQSQVLSSPEVDEAASGSAILVDDGSTASAGGPFSMMRPLRTYVKGCDGRLYQSASL